MTLGAEPKKVALLGVLVVVILAAWFWNSSGDSPSPAPSTRARLNNTPDAIPAGNPAPQRTRSRPANSEFTARVPGSRPDDHPDPGSIDPKLHLELLAKVQAVPPIEGGRNLFQFGAAPAPPTPIPAVPTGVQKIAINQPPPKQTTQVLSDVHQGPPPAPPITLKYYGYTVSKADGRKKAMLLDGDEIFLAVENQTLKQRYRIARIANNSIDIEDTQYKSTQTLKLQEPPT